LLLLVLTGLGGIMSNADVRDRRFRVPGPALTPRCRLCWRTIALGRDLVETTDLHVYAHCPHCGGSFPIRHSDVGAFPHTEDAPAPT